METSVKQISLDLIDAPAIAMRTDVDGDDIQTLMQDMQEVGLIEPIVVRRRGDRYEIVAGHRRSRAARLLGWGTIEAKIIDATDEETLSMRLIENLSRHEVDPVDEAIYIGEIAQTHKMEPREIAEKLHRSEDWVLKRLEVFHMPDYLQDALKYKQIPLGAALWLNKIQDDRERRSYVVWCRVNGIKEAQAKQWYYNTIRPEHSFDSSEEIVPPTVNEPQKVVTLVCCDRCKVQVALPDTDSVWVHRGVCPS